MSTAALRHRTTGVPIEDWLEGWCSAREKEIIGLRDIDLAIRHGFDVSHREWFETMDLCIKRLVELGFQPMLFDDERGEWEWTDRFDSEAGEMAGYAVTSWVAFGDSGGAEDLRFAKALPD